MELTEDSYRALARSSPWRWQSLHLRRHTPDPLEAWIDRPGRLRVVDAKGLVTQEQVQRGDSSGVVSFYSTDDGEAPSARKPKVIRRWPHEVQPALRPDGLVERRPDEIAEHGPDFVTVEFGDPMYENYHWVAMLDPRELSEHTVVSDLRVDEHRGRPVWRARVAPVEGYDPTCGCCALLWSEISDRDEYDDDWPLDPDRVYPEAYDVALDVGTGIVARLEPIGESTSAELVDLEILETAPWPVTAG